MVGVSGWLVDCPDHLQAGYATSHGTPRRRLHLQAKLLLGGNTLLASIHLGNLSVVLVLVISVDMAVSGAGRGVDGAFAFLEPRGGNLGGVCKNMKWLVFFSLFKYLRCLFWGRVLEMMTRERRSCDQ